MNYLLFALILLMTASTIFAQASTPSPDRTTETVVPFTVQTNPSNAAKSDDGSRSRYVGKKSPVAVPLSGAPPVIDGILNEPMWESAALFGDFLQTNPGDNIAPKHQTEFMMAYDSKHLYMAFKIKQDRNTVRATLSPR